MAYLESKDEGDNSMSEKQRVLEGAKSIALRARVIWQRLDCFKPNLHSV